jgi:hypothetical protein
MAVDVECCYAECRYAECLVAVETLAYNATEFFTTVKTFYGCDSICHCHVTSVLV